MSDALDTAFVEIQPDFSTFNRNVESGVRDASQTLDRQLTRTLDGLERDFASFAADASDEIADAMRDIADSGEDSADDVSDAFERVERILDDAFQQAESAALGAFADIEREATEALREVSEEADRTGRDVDDSFRGTGDGIGDSIGDGTERASGGFRGLADSAAGAGLDIRSAMAGAAGAAGIGALIAAAAVAVEAFIDMGQEALELEGDITRIASASQSGFSPVAVDEFRDGLLNLQSEFGVLTEDSVPALQTAIAQGVPEDNAIAFLEEAIQTSIATGGDLEDTVRVLNGLTAQFGDDLGSTAEAADFLTVTLGNTTAETADVGDVIGEISGFARDAGVGVDELGAALAAMSITGRDAGTSGGQLAALVEELGDSTTPVAEAFNELTGQSFQEFIDQGGNLQQAAQIIADGAADAGQSVVELASSAETSSAILALSTEDGAARFNSALAETRDAVGITEETFGNLEDSGSLAFSQLEGSMATLRDEAGAAVAPIVADFAEGLIPIIEDVSPLVQALGEILLEAFSVAGQFLSPLIDLVLGLFESISPLLEILSPLFEILGLIGEIVGTILAPVFEVLFAILTPIFELIATLLSPALEILSFFFELIADLVSEHVAPFLSDLADRIRNNLGPIVDWLSERVLEARLAFRLMIDFVRDNWDTVTDVIGASVGAIGGFFGGIIDAARTAINFIIDGWNRLSFSIPSVDLGPLGDIPGFTVSTPNIPRLQEGGFTTAEGIALLHPDEMVLPLSNAGGISALADALQQAGAAGGDSGGDTTIIVKIGERELTDIVDTRVERNNRTLTRRARAGTGRL